MQPSEFFFSVRIARNVTMQVVGDASGRRMPMDASGIAAMRSAAFGRGGRR